MDAALQKLIDALPENATFHLAVSRDSHGQMQFTCCIADARHSTPLLTTVDTAENAAGAALRYFNDRTHQ